MTYFYFSFINPILMLRHRVMQTRSGLKRNMIPSIQTRIRTLQEKFCNGCENKQERAQVTSQIDGLSKHLWSIRNMSDWPMDAVTRNRFFSLNAIASMLPPLAKLVTSTGVMVTMIPADSGMTEWLQNILGKLF